MLHHATCSLLSPLRSTLLLDLYRLAPQLLQMVCKTLFSYLAELAESDFHVLACYFMCFHVISCSFEMHDNV